MRTDKATRVRWGILGVAKIATEKVIPAIGKGQTGVVAAIASRAADKAQQQKLMPVAVALDAAGQPPPARLAPLAALGADASAGPGRRWHEVLAADPDCAFECVQA